MRADDPERGVRRGALGHVPGDDRAAAQHVLARRVVPSQASVSATCRKPAFSSRSAAFATAWYGDGLAARKDMRSSVWPRSKRGGALMGFTLTTYEGPLPGMGAGPREGVCGRSESP